MMVFNKLYDFKKVLYGISLFSSLIFTGYSVADVNSNCGVDNKSGLERKVLANFPAQDLYEREDIRKYLGLPEELFDSKKENNEILEKGVQLELNKGYFMVVNYTDSSNESKSYAFSIPEDRFKSMLGYIALIDQNAVNNAKKNERKWNNAGEIGLTAEGLRLLVEHAHEINKESDAYANLSISKNNRKVELGVKKQTKNQEQKAGVLYSTGENIDDNDFSEWGVVGTKIDFKKGRADIYQGSFLDVQGNTGTRGKYGYLTTDIDRLVSGFWVGYDEVANDNLSGNIFLGIIDNEFYKSDALFDAMQQIERYDSRNKTGNHPLLSKGIQTQATLGYESGHPNIEVTQKLIGDWFGVFLGKGTIWHDYEPHFGILIQGEKFPGISVSVSDADEGNNFFLNITPPKLKTTKYKEKYY
jgi:hypothetical protein